MTTVTEKNGVMFEKITTGNFSVLWKDRGVTLTVMEKGYREGYGVYELDKVKYHYFNYLADDSAKKSFEDILSFECGGSLDFITFDENIFDKFNENNNSDFFLTEEKLDEFLTFAIELNNLNKG